MIVSLDDPVSISYAANFHSIFLSFTLPAVTDITGEVALSDFTPYLFGILLATLTSFVFSGLEAGLLSISPLWVSEKVEKGFRRAIYIQEALRIPSRLISVMLSMEITSNVVLTVLWNTVGLLILNLSGLPDWTLVIWNAVLLIYIVTFLEIFPKSIFTTHTESLTMFFAPLAIFLIKVVYPVVAVLEWLSSIVIRIVTGKKVNPRITTVTEQDLMNLVKVGTSEGVLIKQEQEMIHSIFEFGDRVAREVMVPRVDSIMLDIDDEISTALDAIINSGHSRIPVYEGSIDHIKGILYAKDLLRYIENNDLINMSLRDIIRPEILFIPETRDLSSLLEEMQVKKAHIGIVIDEYGGTEGLVSIEDILEEIVGEIQDEYDEPFVDLIVRNPDGSYLIDASIGLHDIYDQLDLQLPESEGIETLGGLLYQGLGRVPVAGDTITFRSENFIRINDETDKPSKRVDVNFKILDVDDNRIGQVHTTLTEVVEYGDDENESSFDKDKREVFE